MFSFIVALVGTFLISYIDVWWTPFTTFVTMVGVLSLTLVQIGGHWTHAKWCSLRGLETPGKVMRRPTSHVSAVGEVAGETVPTASFGTYDPSNYIELIEHNNRFSRTRKPSPVANEEPPTVQLDDVVPPSASTYLTPTRKPKAEPGHTIPWSEADDSKSSQVSR